MAADGTGMPRRSFRRAIPELTRLGGSNAQRDVYIDLAVSASVQAGDFDAAREVAKRRWTRRAEHLDDAWLDRLCARENRVTSARKSMP